jgi:hypothetical protein
MKINEVTDSVTSQLVGLAEFLLGQTQDFAAPKKINLKTFIELAQDITGSTFTPEQIIDMAEKPPLNTIIANVERDQIIFKGNDSTSTPMSVDKSQEIVSRAAQRAAKKRS